ncbi:unnamed protein product [Discula destructiva]
MESTATHAKPVAGRPPGLLDIPQHIRLRIYSYAMQPFLILMLTQREHIVETRQERRENFGTAGISLPDRVGRENSDDASWDEQCSAFTKGPSRIPTLGYRISTFSPLLVVSKQVSSELSAWIASSGLQSSLHATVRRCVAGDTVTPSRDHDFSPLVEHSRLVVSASFEETSSFLQRLPHDVRSRIHSVALGRFATLVDDNTTRLAWYKRKTERYAAYVEALRHLLPNLCEIALQVPISGWQRDMFCTATATELADMLLDGMVDSVRFLYEESHGAALLDSDTSLETVQATTCLACGQRQSWMAEGVLKRCSRCLSAYYCSPLCQKTDWKSHRAWCLEADESEKRKPQRDVRLPRFDAVLEEHVDGDSGKILLQTAATPRNQWLQCKTVIVLRRPGLK